MPCEVLFIVYSKVYLVGGKFMVATYIILMISGIVFLFLLLGEDKKR